MFSSISLFFLFLSFYSSLSMSNHMQVKKNNFFFMEFGVLMSIWSKCIYSNNCYLWYSNFSSHYCYSYYKHTAMVTYHCQFGWTDKAWEPNESYFRTLCEIYKDITRDDNSMSSLSSQMDYSWDHSIIWWHIRMMTGGEGQ